MVAIDEVNVEGASPHAMFGRESTLLLDGPRAQWAWDLGYWLSRHGGGEDGEPTRTEWDEYAESCWGSIAEENAFREGFWSAHADAHGYDGLEVPDYEGANVSP